MTKSLQFKQAMLVLLVMCAVFAPPEADAQDGTITGKVVNWNSSQPVASATITLSKRFSEISRQTESDPNGRFIFDGLSYGRYTLTAKAEGYIPRPGGRRSGFMTAVLASARGVLPFDTLDRQPERFPVDLEPDLPVVEIEIPLAQGGVISGHVRASSGEAPIDGVFVWTFRRVATDTGSELLAVDQVRTDENGFYRVASLVQGEYLVAVDDLDHPVTYYPNREFSTTAVPIRVETSGEVSRIDFYLGNEGPVVSLSGTLATPPGWQAPFIFFLVREKFGTNDPLVTRTYFNSVGDVPGTYRIDGVRPGYYHIFALGEEGIRGGYYSSVGIIRVEEESLEDVHLEFRPSVRIEGVVDFDDGFDLSPRSLRIALEPTGPLSKVLDQGQPVGTRFEARISPSGEFTFSEVPQGTFSLSLGMPTDVFVESVRLDGSNVVDRLSKLAILGSTRELNVILHSNAGVIRGVVRAGNLEAVPFARVLLQSVRARLGRSLAITADSEGRFSLSRLAPGDYRIVALPPEDEVSLPTSVEALGGETLTVRPGLNSDVRLAVRVR